MPIRDIELHLPRARVRAAGEQLALTRGRVRHVDNRHVDNRRTATAAALVLRGGVAGGSLRLASRRSTGSFVRTLDHDESRNALGLPKNMMADLLPMSTVFSSPARFVLEPPAEPGRHAAALSL
jgi:hypothetical protein